MDYNKIPKYVLEELAIKFDLFQIQFSLKNSNKLMSLIQKCHWMCCDNYYINIKFKSFAYKMFDFLPNLRKHKLNGDFIAAFNQFLEYNHCRQKSGAIIISEDKNYVLLVQAFASHTWWFPGGKLEEEDSIVDGSYCENTHPSLLLDPLARCACREVFEETSLDITKLINPHDYYRYDKRTRLYWIENFPKDHKVLRPNTRGEIADIKWHCIDTLINLRSYRSFSRVSPFLNELMHRIRK